MALLATSCGTEEGLYLDIDAKVVRRDGVVITIAEFEAALVDDWNQEITVIEDSTVRRFTYDPFDSGIGLLLDRFRQKRNPELLGNESEQNAAGQPATRSESK